MLETVLLINAVVDLASSTDLLVENCKLARNRGAYDAVKEHAAQINEMSRQVNNLGRHIEQRARQIRPYEMRKGVRP